LPRPDRRGIVAAVSRKTKRILALIGFPLLIAAIIAVVAVFWRDLWSLFTSGDKLRDWVASQGAAAPLVFIAVQALQVVVFIIPGEVPQIAGGYLFGTWLGTLLSITGILLGSIISFFLARFLGVPFVHALFPKEQVKKVESLLSSRNSKIVFFLLFLIPGIPKDILCYVAGLTPMRFVFFTAISFLGRLPGILGSALIGDAAAGERWLLAGIVLGVAVLLFMAGFILRPRIEKWMSAISGKKKGGGEAVPPAPTEPPTTP
jgi:uncharacterized membrane protein YdjX (TVP38/TMEM64 family)